MNLMQLGLLPLVALRYKDNTRSVAIFVTLPLKLHNHTAVKIPGWLASVDMFRANIRTFCNNIIILESVKMIRQPPLGATKL